jgi:hypothetical protein
VLHRRANLTRPRTIVSMAARALPGTNCFALALRTQAGTYVKEFVHGELEGVGEGAAGLWREGFERAWMQFRARAAQNVMPMPPPLQAILGEQGRAWGTF